MIKSVQKALNILTLISNNLGQPVTVSEISHQLSLNKSTCCHLLDTLETEGFATNISRSKGYILGPAAYCLTRYDNYKNQFIATVKPIINYLHQNLKHTVALAIIESEKKYIIDYIDGDDLYEDKPKIMSDDIYRTATGRAILANMHTDEIYKIYQKFGKPKPDEWNEITSLDDLYAFVKNSKNEQIFKSVQRKEDGIYSGFASPLFSKKGCVGSIGVGLKTQKPLSQKEENEIKSYLLVGAKIANMHLKNQNLSD